MAQKGRAFVVSDSLGLKGLQSELERHVQIREEGPETRRLAYRDTFDWRLYAKGSALEEEAGVGARKLRWRALNNGTNFGTLRETGRETGRKTGAPRFVWDLPKGGLRDRLSGVVEMRALIPIAEIESRVRPLRVVNRDEKTVLRILLEENHLLGEKGRKSRSLGTRVRLVPVKGYDKPLRKLAKLLEQDLALTPTESDPLLVALAARGARPGAYSSKLRVHLTADMTADAALRKILLHLLDTIEINEAGTRDDIDSEFLHDLRVAIRRTRSALTQIKHVLPLSAVRSYLREFAWLGQMTSPTRDMDVYLLHFGGYQESVEPEMRADLEPLKRFLEARKASAHAAMVEGMNSERARGLLRDWRVFLEQDPKIPGGRDADRPVIEIAGLRILKAYRRVLRQGGAIDAGTPATALHELRKSCKKLRYLLEFFSSLYLARRSRPLIQALKELQDNLGAFQDFDVQGRTLRRFGREMAEAHQAPPPTLVAMGVLIEGLNRRQQAAREEFTARFTTFASARNRKAFEALCALPAPGGKRR